MRFCLFYYECKNCGKIFKSLVLLGGVYGECILRARNNEMVCLNSFKDKVFDEVQRIFKNSKKRPVAIAQHDEIKLFQSVFSVVCGKDAEMALVQPSYII